MLVEEITLYKSKIQSKIFSLSQEMGSVAFVGSDINERCVLELFTFLTALDYGNITEQEQEELLSYLIWKYELSEVDVLPFTFPNVEYISDGFNSALYYTKTEVDALLEGVDPVFPVGTPNVNVAVGGWFAGYVLAGKAVVNALIDLGIQFISPATSISIQSIAQSTSGFIVQTTGQGANVERGIRITGITINRARTLGSATFVSGNYTQPNISPVSDDPSGIVPAFNLSTNNLFVGNVTSGTNPPTYTINLLSRYSRTPSGPIDPTLDDNDPLVITFVSPVYFGALPLASTTNAAAIQGLGKASLANSRARSNLSFSPTALAGRLVYAYPTRLLGLNNIQFEGFSANQLLNFNNPIVVSMSFGLNAPNEDYNVYVYSTDVSPSTIVASFS
jgi:hypothetical protein